MFLLIDEEGERRNICNVSFLLLPHKNWLGIPEVTNRRPSKRERAQQEKKKAFFYSLRVSKLFFFWAPLFRVGEEI